jgi:hypothetical protein
METTDVINQNGTEINFDTAVELMDNYLREQLHIRQEWASKQEFFTAYESAHLQKYGTEWELSKANPTY